MLAEEFWSVIIFKGMTEFYSRAVNKTTKRYELANLTIAQICYSDGQKIRCINLNAVLVEQEHLGPCKWK